MPSIRTISGLAVVAGLLFSAPGLRSQDKKPERLKWHDSLKAAMEEAEATGKPIFLEFRCAP